jgi:hypothetical protein
MPTPADVEMLVPGELVSVLREGISPAHLAAAGGVAPGEVATWTPAHRQREQDALIDRVVRRVVVESVWPLMAHTRYGLPEDADVRALLDAGTAPAEMLREWHAIMDQPEGRFCHQVIQDAVRRSPGRAVRFLQAVARTGGDRGDALPRLTPSE